MSTWAITGGSGFLGHHLARELVGAGHAVRTLDVVHSRIPGVQLDGADRHQAQQTIEIVDP